MSATTNDSNRRHYARRARLTRAINQSKRTGDNGPIINACVSAIHDFDAHGWPDDWTRWERALRDTGEYLSLDDLHEEMAVLVSDLSRELGLIR